MFSVETVAWNGFQQYLSLGDIHQHSKAGHVVTLTAYVTVVPVEHLAAFRRPATSSSNPKHTCI